MAIPRIPLMLSMMVMLLVFAESGDNNRVFSPCADTTVQKSDGFTFGIAFASRDKFSYNNTLLSPCDRRLALSSQNSQIAAFRPKVDEISLLSINTTSSFFPVSSPSSLAFVSNSTYTVTSFTLVLEFKKGRLQNLYWKRDGCSACSGDNKFVCLNNQDCAIKTTDCKGQGQGASVDCSLGIQLAFSGTDKHYSVLNSWYEVKNLRQYSLYGLYANLADSLTSQYNKIF
ncbi:hypothetical protein AAG906_011112 [Vitis piasezkii]